MHRIVGKGIKEENKMGIIKLNVVDGKGDEVLIDDLTDTGRQMLRGELSRIGDKLEEAEFNSK